MIRLPRSAGPGPAHPFLFAKQHGPTTAYLGLQLAQRPQGGGPAYPVDQQAIVTLEAAQCGLGLRAEDPVRPVGVITQLKQPFLQRAHIVAAHRASSEIAEQPASESQTRVAQSLVGGPPNDPIADQTAALLEGADRVLHGDVEDVGLCGGCLAARFRRRQQPLRGQQRSQLCHRLPGVAAA